MTNLNESDALQKNDFTVKFLQLFSTSNAENPPEAVSVLLHGYMLDIGFLPVNIEEKTIHEQMPDSWKSKGAWKFHYCHKTCQGVHCWMTCVPLYSVLAVHGALDNGNSQNSIYFKIQTTNYVNKESSLQDPENLFVNCIKLEKMFKDEFGFPLLALSQKEAGSEPSFGLSVTVDEVKLCIFKLLPVESIVSLAAVNKDFYRVSNFPMLWKFLLQRDFGIIDDPSSSSQNDYKEVYKREYLKRKQRVRRPLPIMDPYYFPTIFPTGAPHYIDLRRDLDPALQQAFPHLRDRFRPNWIFPPYDFPGRFM